MHSIKYLFSILQMFLFLNTLGTIDTDIIVFRAFDTEYNIDYSNKLLKAIAEDNASLVKDTIKLNSLDVNSKNSLGCSLLHIACRNNTTLEVINALLEYGADFNIQDNNQKTALHHLWYKALINKERDLSDYFEKSFILVQSGANVNLFDNNQLTCLDLIFKVSNKYFNDIEEKDMAVIIHATLLWLNNNPTLLTADLFYLCCLVAGMLNYGSNLHLSFAIIVDILYLKLCFYMACFFYKIFHEKTYNPGIYLDNISKSLKLKNIRHSKEVINFIKEISDQYIYGEINLSQLKMINKNLNNNWLQKIIDLLDGNGNISYFIEHNTSYKQFLYWIKFNNRSDCLENYLTKKIKTHLNNIDKLSNYIANNTELPYPIGLKISSYLDKDTLDICAYI